MGFKPIAMGTRAVYSPRHRYARRPSLPQAGKRGVPSKLNPLSDEVEERVVQRSVDRVSKRRAFITATQPNIKNLKITYPLPTITNFGNS